MPARTLRILLQRGGSAASHSSVMAASIFAGLASAVVKALTDAHSAVRAPAPAPQPPVELTRGNANDMKRLLPGSVVEFNDGTFATVPLKGAVVIPSAVQSPPVLVVSKGGSLSAGAGATQQITDLSSVNRIVLGVCSDRVDSTAAGSAAASLRTAMGPAAIYPVPATPFVELEVESPRGASPVKSTILNALKAVGASWRMWGAAAPAAFLTVAGLPDLAASSSSARAGDGARTASGA